MAYPLLQNMFAKNSFNPRFALGNNSHINSPSNEEISAEPSSKTSHTPPTLHSDTPDSGSEAVLVNGRLVQMRFDENGRRSGQCHLCKKWIGMGKGTGDHTIRLHEGSARCEANQRRLEKKTNLKDLAREDLIRQLNYGPPAASASSQALRVVFSVPCVQIHHLTYSPMTDKEQARHFW